MQRARTLLSDPRATFEIGDAMALDFPDGRFDAAVSGLVLNFVPEPATAVAELVRVTRPSGTTAAYVWDYAEGMTMLRHFWDAAIELDPAAAALDEGVRFTLCRPETLRTLWEDGGLADVAVDQLVVEARFEGFDDYWAPFLGGQAPAPGYVVSLPEDHRTALRERPPSTVAHPSGRLDHAPGPGLGRPRTPLKRPPEVRRRSGARRS